MPTCKKCGLDHFTTTYQNCLDAMKERLAELEALDAAVAKIEKHLRANGRSRLCSELNGDGLLTWVRPWAHGWNREAQDSSLISALIALAAQLPD